MSEVLQVAAKFGGTSMAQPHVVAEIVEARDDHRVVVVSAPGTDECHSQKMTSQLEQAANLIASGDEKVFEGIRDDVIDRFDSLYADLDSKPRLDLRDAGAALFRVAWDGSNAEADTMSIGEELSARYFAELIGARYIAPNWVQFTNAGRLRRQNSVEALQESLQYTTANEKIVTPGFFGFDQLGRRQLLGRGGSDRTGALAGLALAGMYGDDAVVYENWTDQDGIYSADPDSVRGTILLDMLTRREVREGAHGGNRILQGDVIVDLNGSSIPTVVRNTFNPDSPGTQVVTERDVDPGKPVIAVSARELMTVSVEDLGMADADGYLRRVMTDATAYDLSIEHMPAAQDAVTLTLHKDALLQNIEAFAESLRRNALSSHAEVVVAQKGVVYLVGEALANPLTNARVLGDAAMLLANNGIGIDAMVSHPRSPSVALLVDEGVDRVQQKMHSYFIGRQYRSLS